MSSAPSAVVVVLSVLLLLVSSAASLPSPTTLHSISQSVLLPSLAQPVTGQPPSCAPCVQLIAHHIVNETIAVVVAVCSNDTQSPVLQAECTFIATHPLFFLGYVWATLQPAYQVSAAGVKRQPATCAASR